MPKLDTGFLSQRVPEATFDAYKAIGEPAGEPQVPSGPVVADSQDIEHDFTDRFNDYQA